MWFLRSKSRADFDEIELRKLRVTIGSSESADVRVHGPSVEPLHAVLEQSAGVLRIFDLATQTGTVVNGVRVAAKELSSGDHLNIGGAELILDAHSKAQLAEIPQWEREGTLQSRPSQLFRERAGTALEWVQVWNDHLLDVRHFSLPLKRRVNSWMKLVGDSVEIRSPQNQEDVLVYRGGALSAMASVSLKPGDLVKVVEGARASWLSLGPQLPELLETSRQQVDPLFRKILGISLGSALVVFLGLYFLVRVDPQTLSDVPPEHIVKLLQPPERETPLPHETLPPIAQPLPAQEKVSARASLGGGPKVQTNAPAQEGQGAKASGASGKRGSPTATRSQAKPQNRAERPSSKPGVGRGGSQSSSDSIGNVDLLQGAGKQIENLLGQSSKRLGATGGTQTKGTGRDASVGSSGLATQGAASGGGGDQGLEGLAKTGVGAGKVGSGLGAAGRGNGVLGGGGTVVLVAGEGGGGEISGGLSTDAIRAAILRHRSEFQLCYERELNMGTVNRAGTIFFSWVIDAAGRTREERAPRTTLNSDRVSSCALGVLKRIQFPKPVGGQSVFVKEMPFKFSPLGRS